MLESGHYQRCLEEQIGVLVAHQTSSPEPDYTFIRDHAQAILQLCDQAIADKGSGGETTPEGTPSGRPELF